jgi:hypothetical protein
MVLIAFGAILTWAVDAHPNGLNVTAVGVILMVVGLIGLLLWLVLWERLGSDHPAAAYDVHDVAVGRRPYPERRPRRSTTVVEEERSEPPPA